METTTRIYWQTNDDGPDGWEAQRNDGTWWGIGGHEDDSSFDVFTSLAHLAPGADFGVVTFERDVF